MPAQKNQFRHDSIQDAESIQHLIKAVAKGLKKGKLTFEDEDGEIVLRPEGLLNFKLTASKEDGRNRLTLRVSWQEELDTPKNKQILKVK